MLALLKTKLAVLLLGALAVTGATGTAAVVAAHAHAGPFAQGGIFAQQQSAPHAQATKTPEGGAGTSFQGQGLIQSVTFAAGNVSGTLVFLPDGTTTPITVQFTTQTHVEVADGSNQHSTSQGNLGAPGLKAGLYANIVGTLQTNGSVLAKEIQANANGKAHQGGGQATPTPGPGHGHHDGTPTPVPGHGHHDGTPTPATGQ